MASFQGNIGDVINHAGTRRIFKKNLNYKIAYNNLEFRNFFFKLEKFDNKLINYINKHDLLIIGGGGFLEILKKKTDSGCSIDISLQKLKLIKKPILFYALGSDLTGATKKNITKFKKFMNYCLNNKKIFFSIRNDGTNLILKKILKKEQLKKISIVPDGGFYYKKKQIRNPLKKKKFRIGINLAGDMLNKRFGNNKTYISFLVSFSKIITKVIKKFPKIKFVMNVHIWKDYLILSKLLTLISDQFIRKNIEITGLGFDEKHIKSSESEYNSCDLIIANRFHSHILAIVNNLPIISLCNYPQITNFYKENNFKFPIILTNQKKSINNIYKLLTQFYSKKKISNKFYGYNINSILRLEKNHSKINKWLKYNLV